MPSWRLRRRAALFLLLFVYVFGGQLGAGFTHTHGTLTIVVSSNTRAWPATTADATLHTSRGIEGTSPSLDGR